MTLPELIPSIEALPRADKLQLIRLLAADVAREEAITGDVADKTVPIWSPYDSFEGAAMLLRALNQEKGPS